MAIEVDLSSALLPLNNGRTVSLGGGSTMTFRVSGEDTGGAYSVLEYAAAPGSGAAMHVHRNEDESFLILGGAITFQLGDDKTRATPGMFIRIPKGLRHAFVNAEPEPARALVILIPAGLEFFFAEISELLRLYPSGPPAEAVQSLTDKYGLDFGPFEPAGA
jgi:quercetin dioxygenase-like cupin family protein